MLNKCIKNCEIFFKEVQAEFLTSKKDDLVLFSDIGIWSGSI